MVVAGGSAEAEQQSVIGLDVSKQELVLKLRRCVRTQCSILNGTGCVAGARTSHQEAV